MAYDIDLFLSRRALLVKVIAYVATHTRQVRPVRYGGLGYMRLTAAKKEM